MIDVLIISQHKFLEEALHNCTDYTFCSTSAPHINNDNYLVKLVDLELALQVYKAGELVVELDKPLKLNNLIAVLNKALIKQKMEEIIVGGIKFFPQRREVLDEAQGVTASLTEKETEIIKILLLHPEGISKELLLQEVWAYHADTLTSTAETHIYRLRQKLKLANIPWQITVMGNFYQLVSG